MYSSLIPPPSFSKLLLTDVVLTPSKKWDGQGMLGVTIRFDYYDQAEEHLVRVLEVVPNSPAELAGLQPLTDFLLGTAETVFKDPDVLEDILSKNLENTVDFYVYNTETDTVRTATLMPNLKWGGRGCLGAEIGHGYLHGLPQKCCSSNGTSVFKAPAPHIADATRVAGPTGPVARVRGGSQDVAVDEDAVPAVVDVDLQQKKQQQLERQQLQPQSQPQPQQQRPPSTSPSPRQEG